MRAHAGLLLAATLALGFAAPASARPRLIAADPAALGARPIPPIRDTVVRGRGEARAARTALAGFGGVYTTADGSRIQVRESPSFTPDAAALQNWANLFGGFVHGAELSRLSVYLAPYAEMQSICSAGADSCYLPDRELIVLVGEPPPDGQSVEELAAHEYGHHIAENRDDAPWNAGDWGPKYWSTEEDVCDRVRAGTAFPGDEGSHYALDPGEAWAETNRVLNGGTWAGIIDDSFSPTREDLYWARQDILHPFTGGHAGTWRGRFRPGRSRDRLITLPVQNDGDLELRLRASPGLDADLYLYAGARRVRRAATDGRTERLAYRSCGYRRLTLRIHRYRGFGGWSLRASLPYDNPKVP